MSRRFSTRLVGGVHQLHRWTGTCMSVLMAVWFASGAVMTFADYPAYTDEERLARSQPLAPPSGASRALATPPALVAFLERGGLASGHARLAMLEGEPRWLLQDATSYLALGTEPPWQARPLDDSRARAEAERTHGECRGSAELITEPDQWTVGRSHAGSYPLQRLACNDSSGLVLHVSTRSGEIVQQSTRAERAWAWLGPIPHWIYPALLRRDRELWRSSVLWLSAFGCVTTLSGLIAGLHSAMRRRRNGRQGRSVQRQAYLLWHQRLGLGFGALAFTWVFSGALSLEPFHWATATTQPARAWSGAPDTQDLERRLDVAIERCRSQLPELRELELILMGHLHVLCSDARAQTRIVDLDERSLTPGPRLTDEQLARLASAVGAQLTLSNSPDDYYYPTHRRPMARPYARFALQDAAHTVLYVDPTRAVVIDQLDDKRRLERWLYHGLHSWDLPVLYRHETLWRTLLVLAMLSGTALATTGLLRLTRRRRRSPSRH